MDLNRNGKDDFLEVADGIVEAVTNAAHWVQGILVGLAAEAAQAPQLFADVLNHVKTNDDGSAKPIGEVVADFLTVIYNDGHHVLEGVETNAVEAVRKVESGVVEAVAGLTLQKVPGK